MYHYLYELFLLILYPILFRIPHPTTANTVGAIAGIVGPIIVSAFVSAWPGVWGWRLAFLLTGVYCM